MRCNKSHCKRALRLAVLVFAFVFMSMSAGMVSAAPFDENRPKVGEEAREFEIQGFKLSDLKGKKNIVLVFYRGHF